VSEINKEISEKCDKQIKNSFENYMDIEINKEPISEIKLKSIDEIV